MSAQSAEKCRAGNTVPPGKMNRKRPRSAQSAESAEVEGGGGGKLPSKKYKAERIPLGIYMGQLS